LYNSIEQYTAEFFLAAYYDAILRSLYNDLKNEHFLTQNNIDILKDDLGSFFHQDLFDSIDFTVLIEHNNAVLPLDESPSPHTLYKKTSSIYEEMFPEQVKLWKNSEGIDFCDHQSIEKIFSSFDYNNLQTPEAKEHFENLKKAYAKRKEFFNNTSPSKSISFLRMFIDDYYKEFCTFRAELSAVTYLQITYAKDSNEIPLAPSALKAIIVAESEALNLTLPPSLLSCLDMKDDFSNNDILEALFDQLEKCWAKRTSLRNWDIAWGTSPEHKKELKNISRISAFKDWALDVYEYPDYKNMWITKKPTS
jgi:hypothetical protein